MGVGVCCDCKCGYELVLMGVVGGVVVVTVTGTEIVAVDVAVAVDGIVAGFLTPIVSDDVTIGTVANCSCCCCGCGCGCG